MAKHIGIVGITWPGALLCYQSVCEEGAAVMGPDYYPETTLHSFAAADYIPAVRRGEWDTIAELMVRSAEKLAGSGAHFAISPANTAHEAFDAVVRRSPIPWISIVEATADEAVRRGWHTVGVLGTTPVLERPFYRDTLARKSVAMKVPPPAVAAEMQQRIVQELVRNVFTDQARAFFRDAANGLQNDGCDAVVMACTEIPLILRQEDVEVPLLDSTRILARAAVAEALRP